jgi:hypothetical protein
MNLQTRIMLLQALCSIITLVYYISSDLFAKKEAVLINTPSFYLSILTKKHVIKVFISQHALNFSVTRLLK